MPLRLLMLWTLLLVFSFLLLVIRGYPLQTYYQPAYTQPNPQPQMQGPNYADLRINTAPHINGYHVNRDVAWIGGGQPMGWTGAQSMPLTAYSPMKLSVLPMANRLMSMRLTAPRAISVKWIGTKSAISVKPQPKLSAAHDMNITPPPGKLAMSTLLLDYPVAAQIMRRRGQLHKLLQMHRNQLVP
ncbi:uncharacterized protein LOC129587177 isoform X2 [Paramacrobiotus metropolitanus]|uniref:uncharacterized protein LOC129587177 isoform X2 n=1 Tax=Paramacrobiotus metropolitanus TaxID=2943436 RepID=UPI0024465BE3|nr:uncharacterized protein LOC129587177 isoform X2 [Paramacrobiotus metropolitanus]